MASPFSIFRKNQKLMYALLTIMVMFGFVFLPIMLQTSGSRTVVNPVVVKTTQFGDLRHSDIGNLIRGHQIVLRVLAGLRQEADGYGALAERRAEILLGPGTERNVVNIWLLARYAGQLGLTVSDETINTFIQEWTQNAVKPEKIQAIFKRSGLSDFQFFSLMRDELAARQIRQMFLYSLLDGQGGFVLTPAERWECFLRVKQMAGIEAVPVPVANYIDRVEDPGDEKLAAFFDEHKAHEPVPGSPEPGFREPHKVALQWFKADFEKLSAAVTDEEIKARYEKNKEAYDQLEKKPEAKKEEEEEKASTKDTKAAEEKKAADEKKPAEVTKPAEEKKPSQEKKPEATPAAAEKPVEPKSGLAEATKTRIRREIAYEKIQKIFEGLRKPLEQYRSQWSQYEVTRIQWEATKEDTKSEKTLPPPPPKPDFEKLAKENGLSTGQIGLVSQWAAQSLEIGASLVGGRDPVWHYAYASLSEFRPEESLGMSGGIYLFWKTNETKERTVKFDEPDVRERVLHAWKMVQARPLALKAAESLAAEAAKAKKTLKETFADRPDIKVVVPPEFSWITFGNVPLGSAPNAARISNVPEVDMAGEDFMRAVFRLAPGQTGAALNNPETVAYVIQMTALSPSQNVLWKQFEVDDFSKYAPAVQVDRQRIVAAWLDEIKASAGFEWARKPDRMVESGPREEEQE